MEDREEDSFSDDITSSLITGASPSFLFLVYHKAIYKLGKKPGNEATPAPLYERSPSVVSTRYTVYVLEILWLV